MSTLRISNIEAKSVPASATIDEKVKITNSSGDTLVFIDGKTSGITTVGINTTDSNITFDSNSNIVVTGIITATKFSGQFEPTNLTMSGDLSIADKIIHTGDTNTAIRFPSADTISAETGGTERLRISSNGLVNIGAGSNASGLSPLLHLHKNASNSTAYLHITNNTTGITNNDGFLLGINGVGDCLVFNKDSTPIRFATQGIERLRINSNGKVIVGNNGTTFGNAAVQAFIQHGNTAGESGFSSVDTTSVAAGVGGEIAFHGKYNTGAQDWAYFGHIRGTKENATAGDTACALKFFTRPNAVAPVERLRIDSTGRVAVNQPAGTGFTTGKVHIKSSASNIGQLYLEQNNATDGFMINQDGPNGGHLKFVRDVGGTQTVNVLFRSDRGICFNGDTAAANALDDYEEGVYTPTVTGSGSGSYTLNSSYNKLAYTKIGRIMHITGRFRLSAKSSGFSGDYVRVTLPTTSNVLTGNGDAGRVTGTVYVQSSGKAVNDFVILPTMGGNSYLFLAHVDFDGTAFNNMNAQMSGDELVSINVTYVSQ